MSRKDFHNAHKDVVDMALFCFAWATAAGLLAGIIVVAIAISNAIGGYQ